MSETYQPNAYHEQGGNAYVFKSGGSLKLEQQGGALPASGLLLGRGTSASPATTSTADAKFLEFRCQSTATSGDNRLMYLRYDINGIGGGECLRAFTKLTAAVGTARGAHISLDMSTDGSISGLGVGVDAQLLLPGEAVTTGTMAVLQAEIFSVASTTITNTMSFLRCVAGGSDATAKTNIEENAFFLDLAGVTVGSGKFIDNDITTGTGYAGLRVKIPGVGTRYVFLVSG